MAKILIGYGYTNSSGVATMDYDAEDNPLNISGYTGVGAGEMDFIAEMHDDSTVVSEPYPVTDCVLIDTDGSNWNISNTTITKSVETNGVKFGNNTSTTGYMNLNKPNSPQTGLDYDWEGDYCFEFNMPLSNTKDDIGMQVVGTSGGTGTAFSKTLTQLGIVNGSHVRVTVIDGNVTVYVDNNTPIATTNNINNAYRISFYLVASKYIILDNFRIYPI